VPEDGAGEKMQIRNYYHSYLYFSGFLIYPPAPTALLPVSVFWRGFGAETVVEAGGVLQPHAIACDF
jgi:hypothetical protein